MPNIFYLWPVPVVTAFTAYLGWMGLQKGLDALPFISAIGLFLLGYMGLVISWFPYLVPPSVTVWDAAAAPVSQMFMLVGTLILLPFILGYTVLIYWLFRGKVAEGESLSLSLCGRRDLRADHSPADAQQAAIGPGSSARMRAALPPRDRERRR